MMPIDVQNSVEFIASNSLWTSTTMFYLLYIVICGLLWCCAIVIPIILSVYLYHSFISIKRQLTVTLTPLLMRSVRTFINLPLIRFIFYYREKYTQINKIDNSNILIQDFQRLDQNIKSNVVITLTTIPTRLVEENIFRVMDSLAKQTVSAKLIVLNICVNYKRTFDIENKKIDSVLRRMVTRYKNLVINYSYDYGPITKILGLSHLCAKKYPMSDDDIVIVVDDDCPLDKNMVYHHIMCHQLYGSDCVFVDEKKLLDWVLFKKYNMEMLRTKSTYHDNYQGMCYGWLTYSMKWYCIDGLKDFYEEILRSEPLVFMHDDLILTLWYKHKQYYSCGINLMFNLIDDQVFKTMDQGLHNLRFAMINRILMEHRLLNRYCIQHSFIRNKIYDNKTYGSKNVVRSVIKPRYMLSNTDSVDYDNQDNFHDVHVDIKYHNQHTVIITLTFFTYVPESFTVNLRIKGQDPLHRIAFPLYNYSKKQTFFIPLDNVQENVPEDLLESKVHIIQTSFSNNVSLYRYYSISTILNNVPFMIYKFFNNDDVEHFISDSFPRLLDTYNSVKPGAYKADMFRALYIYKNGGLYFDCKQILFASLTSLLEKRYLFVRDTYVFKNYVYNAFLYSKEPLLDVYRNYLIQMVINIHNRNYCDDPLSISGPGLFGRYVNASMCIDMNNTMDSLYDWSRSYIALDGKVLIKNTYNDYYNENNYISKGHYGHMWSNKQVYDSCQCTIRSNLIKHVAWIRFSDSDRKESDVINMLQSIFIPTTKIPSVDERSLTMKNNKLINKFGSKIHITGLLHLLSHIKAITHLSEMNGEYFLVLEDGINFNNSSLLSKSLDQIIQEIPDSDKDFDILMLQKVYCRELKDEYTSWNYLYNRFISDHIAGTGAYIISKKGAMKFAKDVCRVDTKDEFVDVCRDSLIFADQYIYSHMKTLIYRYNYFESEGKDQAGRIDSKNLIKSSDFQLNVLVQEIFN